jgi:hypothetical protein
VNKVYIIVHLVCDSMTEPLNGASTLSSDLMVTSFTCDIGYTMVGESMSYCLTDGTGWNSSTPSCGKSIC